MSRYALEWAKGQHPGDPTAKLVLLLIADRAASNKHRCALFDESLAKEVQLTLDELACAVASLTDQDLLQSIPWTLPYYDQSATRYELRIPEGLTFGRLAAPRRSPGREEMRTALYRLFAADGDLLYVGIASDPPRRFKQHEQAKPWWSSVALREIEWFESRSAAESAECRAIVEEKPRHNEQNSMCNAWTPGGGIRGIRQP